MIKKNLEILNIDVYEETLKNGLNLYIVPIKDKNNIYVTFFISSCLVSNESKSKYSILT